MTIILAVPLAGCQGQSSPLTPPSESTGAQSPDTGASGAPPGSTSPGTSPAPSLPGSPAPSDTLLSCGRQGGLVGVDDQLVIQADGAYAIATRTKPVRRGRLADEDLKALKTVLGSPEFANVPRMNVAGGIADGFTYRLVYQGREILASDGGEWPEPLNQVISTCNKILAQANA